MATSDIALKLIEAGCPIEALRAEHPNMLVLRWQDKLAVARPLTAGDLDLLQTNTERGSRRRAATAACKAAIQWPDAAAVAAMFEQHPALPLTWLGALSEHAGVEERNTAEKL